VQAHSGARTGRVEAPLGLRTTTTTALAFLRDLRELAAAAFFSGGCFTPPGVFVTRLIVIPSKGTGSRAAPLPSGVGQGVILTSGSSGSQTPTPLIPIVVFYELISSHHSHQCAEQSWGLLCGPVCTGDTRAESG
jgi:hypothetical protein